jgi:hypothetical protein
MLPAMFLGDWVIPFAYNQTIAGYNYTGYNWLFIGLALALGYMAKEKQQLNEADKNARTVNTGSP